MTCKFWLVNHEFPVPVNTLDQDSLAWLEVITTNLAQGVVLRGLRPGLVTWRHLYDLSGHAVSMSMKFYSKLWSFCRPWSRWSNWIWINNHFAVDFSLGGLEEIMRICFSHDLLLTLYYEIQACRQALVPCPVSIDMVPNTKVQFGLVMRLKSHGPPPHLWPLKLVTFNFQRLS